MCPYAYINEQDRRLKCKLQSVGNHSKYCGYQRFCNIEKEWVNTYKMHQCIIRKENSMIDTQKQNSKIDDTVVLNNKNKTVTKDNIKKDKTDIKQSANKKKTKICRKKFFYKGKLYFTFDNFDLEFPIDKSNSNKDEFVVTYIGNIGKAGFKIISVK